MTEIEILFLFFILPMLITMEFEIILLRIQESSIANLTREEEIYFLFCAVFYPVIYIYLLLLLLAFILDKLDPHLVIFTYISNIKRFLVKDIKY